MHVIIRTWFLSCDILSRDSFSKSIFLKKEEALKKTAYVFISDVTDYLDIK